MRFPAIQKATIIKILLVILLTAYVFAGLRTFLVFITLKPVPQYLLEDFNHYRDAAIQANKHEDPYAERQVGFAYLYPPPALLLIDVVRAIPNSLPFLEQAAYITLNILLLALMVYGVSHAYRLSLAQTWWWYVLCFGFSPFLELLLMGQINILTEFGIFLVFLYGARQPILSGIGLSLSIITKVTPLGFLGYLFINKNWKSIAATLLSTVVLSLIAAARYGVQPFITYIDVFTKLGNYFSLSSNSQSFVAKFSKLFPYWINAPERIQRVYLIYLAVILIVSAVLAWRTGRREPFFILVAIVIAFSPNVMWYHHYIFLLLPALILLGWTRNNSWMVAWIFPLFFLIQIDRFDLTYGALIHIATQLTVWGILGTEIIHLIRISRKQVTTELEQTA